MKLTCPLEPSKTPSILPPEESGTLSWQATVGFPSGGGGRGGRRAGGRQYKKVGVGWGENGGQEPGKGKIEKSALWPVSTVMCAPGVPMLRPPVLEGFVTAGGLENVFPGPALALISLEYTSPDKGHMRPRNKQMFPNNIQCC